jgi:response regulator RpfG family c-di-GMP phosphodiesterase
MGRGKSGEEISLTGRIVALADVFDALISKRVYKESWSEDQVLEYIRSQSGRQFDPNIVSTFFSVYEVIQAIRAKYSDEHRAPAAPRT